MNICIFPGTFNPIHDAHIKMAEFVLEHYEFEKIIFIPAYVPPHKDLNINIAVHRFKMVELATKNNPKFVVSDIEYKSEGKSYSLLTVKKVHEQYNVKDRLNFIIGTDAFIGLDTWYHSEELKPLVHFLVFQRRGSGNEQLYNEFKQKGWSFEILENEFMDVSSTEIRNSTNNQVDKTVEGYIKDYGLYKN